MDAKLPIPPSTRTYPYSDFISEKYDSASDEKLKKIILIISTPRSGSTFLCDQIYSATGMIGHEYFQPHGYIQSLANRWNCFDEHGIDKKKFIKNLIKHRSKDGILVINLHGSHLKIFKEFINYLPTVEFKCIHLIRGDIISQAVSFYIASETKAWSSAYKENAIEPKFDYKKIESKVHKIQGDNLEATCFLNTMGLNFKLVMYENIEQTFPDIMLYAFNKNFQVEKRDGKIKKQATGLNSYFKKRFSLEKLN